MISITLETTKMDCLDCKHIKDIGEIGNCLFHAKKAEKFRQYNRMYMRKWREANPERTKELGRSHQYTWRQKHPDTNRLRSRLGMRRLKDRLNER